jgi:FkbM family methyltransferase
MKDQLRYKLRGIAYSLECLNPFCDTIMARDLPLGLRLETYKRDAVGRGLYRRGVHEPALTKFLLSTFSNGPSCNFIDAGANIGYFTGVMSKLAGRAGKVLAIEPEPQNVRLLERNINLNGLTNVELHACAIGAGEGTARLGLYKAVNRGRHSLVDVGKRVSIDVPVRRLDGLTKKPGGATSWSLLKIDVEGYEGFALDGAAETLSHTEILVTEYSPEYLRKAGFEPALFFENLSRRFSRIFRVRETDLVEVTAAECLRSENQVDLVFRR